MIGAFILHSVSYSGSWGQHLLSVPDFADKAADLGFEGVMLMAKRPHLSVLDWPPKARVELRRRLEKHGFRAICIAGYTNFTADLEHSDIPTREMQIRHVVELAEMARDLGGDLVRVFTAYESPHSTYIKQWNMVVDSLRECAQRAAEFGVTIGVQNHHDLACGFESQFDLIEEINEPNCRAMFDAWAPALHGIDLNAAVSKMARHSVHTTIANYQIRPRYRYVPALVNYESDVPTVTAVPIDEGFIDYRFFLKNMQNAGFEGTVAYEMCSLLRGGATLENLDRYARRFMDFIKQFRSGLPESTADLEANATSIRK
jgi:sugar phosphate isomerase/epimerase